MKSVGLLIIIAICMVFANPGCVKNISTNVQISVDYNELFSQLEQHLQNDNGQLWGTQLYGPILIVDPETRNCIANQNDSKNTFTQHSGYFQGILPEELNVANTAIDWQGQRWTMVMLPLPEDKDDRFQLFIHELFHRIQPEIGFSQLNEISNSHLDSYEGRVLLRLELEALKRALTAANTEETNSHIQNAIEFRKTRQMDEQNRIAENTLELNEGLAEFTGLYLSGRTSQKTKSHLIESIDQFYNNKSFVRSFAYHTIPVYGYILSTKKKNWNKEIRDTTDLTKFLINEFNNTDSINSNYSQLALSNDYPIIEITLEEQKRVELKQLEIRNYKNQFLAQPTLSLQFENMNISFDPTNIIPLGESGTIYPEIRVTDNWGILTVKNGALLSSDWSKITVSVPQAIGDKIVSGKGWNLELADKWQVQHQNGVYELVKN